jgi:hypothetical protein
MSNTKVSVEEKRLTTIENEILSLKKERTATWAKEKGKHVLAIIDASNHRRMIINKPLYHSSDQNQIESEVCLFFLKISDECLAFLLSKCPFFAPQHIALLIHN